MSDPAGGKVCHRAADSQRTDGDCRRVRSGARGKEWAISLQSNNVSENTMVKVNQGEKFSSSIAQGESAQKGWSALVWGENQDLNNEAGNAAVPAYAGIGIGRATGLSRVPDVKLSNSAELMRCKLKNSLDTLRRYEADGLAIATADPADPKYDSFLATASSGWDRLLAEFRQLTMAVTASRLSDVQAMAVNIYESAADACLLSGNLSFYLACQTRLLTEIYIDTNTNYGTTRRTEFTSYSLLYFGVFCEDSRELATRMRVLKRETLSCDHIRFALRAVVAVQRRNARGFFKLFDGGSVRQKTLLSPALPNMRKIALAEMVKAYMSLDKEFAVSLAGLRSKPAFFELLRKERPELASQNSSDLYEYEFRTKRNTSSMPQ